MKSILVCLAFLICTTAVAQDHTPVTAGETRSGTLASDSRHTYTLDLEAEAFVFGYVDQLTVDVVVTVLDAKDNVVNTYDTPARGPEHFTFSTEKKGAYTLAITPFQEAEGDYELVIKRIEPVATDPADKVDQMMAPFSGEETPGVVIGVVDGGALNFVRAYGMANLSHAIPFGTETISNIGSVTKQMTAMGLLLLEAKGKLSLDDDIRDYVPELPDFGTSITLRNLLNHVSGYREFYNLIPMVGISGEDTYDRDHVARIVQRQPELQSEPNSNFSYNNTGYILLATTIERVTDMTFPEYMKAHVFEPLGMDHTLVKAYQGQIIPGSAQGYVPAQGGGYRQVRDLPASYGAGGIYTTTADLAKWMLNYRDHTLGGKEAIDALTTNTILSNGDSTGYGLGLGLGTHRGQTIWAHTGGDVAHRTYFGFYPEIESGVIAMSNNGSFSTGMGRAIAEAFFEDHFEPEEEEEEPEVDEGAMSVERMEAIAGDWEIQAPNASLGIEYTVEDGALHAQGTGQPRFLLMPTSDSTAAFQGVNATVTFHFEADGTVARATHHQGGSVPMVRVESLPLTEAEKPEFEGRYFSEELETFFEIKLEEGELKLHNIRMDPIELSHQTGDTFSTSTFFFATIEFERAGNGQLTGFMASNARTKNVWFRKL